MGETRLGQGCVASCQWLAEHPEQREKLVQELLKPPVEAPAGKTAAA